MLAAQNGVRLAPVETLLQVRAGRNILTAFCRRTKSKCVQREFWGNKEAVEPPPNNGTDMRPGSLPLEGRTSSWADTYLRIDIRILAAGSVKAVAEDVVVSDATRQFRASYILARASKRHAVEEKCNWAAFHQEKSAFVAVHWKVVKILLLETAKGPRILRYQKLPYWTMATAVTWVFLDEPI
jgi:hypothetical protein